LYNYDAKEIADNYWYTYKGSAAIDQPYDCMDVDYYTFMINSDEVKLNSFSYTTWSWGLEWTNTCKFMRWTLADYVDDYGSLDQLLSWSPNFHVPEDALKDH